MRADTTLQQQYSAIVDMRFDNTLQHTATAEMQIDSQSRLQQHTHECIVRDL